MKNKLIGIVLLLAILAFVFRKQIAQWMLNVNGANQKTKSQVLANIETIVDSAVTTDETVYSDEFYISFEAQATQIADAQFSNLNSAFQTETALMTPLMELTGAQLLCVYKAFGSKVYAPYFGSSMNLNLFEWYSYVLTDSGWFGGGDGMVFHDDSIEGCTSWFDSCYEGEFMGRIWLKSGLNVSLFTSNAN